MRGLGELQTNQRGAYTVKWTKPEFRAVTLCMEVTNYVNTGGRGKK